MTAELIPLFPDMEPVKIPKLLQPWQMHSPPSIHHSQESMDASISVLPKQKSLQMKVLEAIRTSLHGLTDEQLVEVTGLAPNTARPRRIELQQAGLIESCGTRATKSGRQAQVWTTKWIA
jgi:hypothetical protein